MKKLGVGRYFFVFVYGTLLRQGSSKTPKIIDWDIVERGGFEEGPSSRPLRTLTVKSLLRKGKPEGREGRQETDEQEDAEERRKRRGKVGGRAGGERMKKLGVGRCFLYFIYETLLRQGSSKTPKIIDWDIVERGGFETGPLRALCALCGKNPPVAT